MNSEKRYPPSEFKRSLEFVLDQDIITIATDPDKYYTKDEIRKLVETYKKQEG